MMERLTRRTETGGIRYTRANISKEDIVERLAYYEDLEEQRELEKKYNGWIPCEKQMPPMTDDFLLIQVNGTYNGIVFKDALELACYSDEGWILEMWPKWEDPDVVAWQMLPDTFKP